MPTSSQPLTPDRQLAWQAREQFAQVLEPLFTDLVAPIRARLTELTKSSNVVSIEEGRLAVDASMRFSAESQRWVAAAVQGWRAALKDESVASTPVGKPPALELLDVEVVEREILASRLSLGVQEAAHWELNDLRLRIQRLEGGRELAVDDVFRPEVLAGMLVKAWVECGLSREMWALVHESVRAVLAKRMTEAYQGVNEFLIQQGGMADIDLKPIVKRAEGSGSSHPTSQADRGLPVRTSATTEFEGGAGDTPSAMARYGQDMQAMASSSPLTRARQRARDVLGQVRRLLADRGIEEMIPVTGYSRNTDAGHRAQLSPDMPNAPAAQAPSGAADSAMMDSVLTGLLPDPPSPPLARALLEQRDPFADTQELGPGGEPATMVLPVSVEVAAKRLWDRATELKAKAERPSEKAVIEIVALMFQAILAEERIPASVRVWFARLQIPVLRLALAEPDFFASVEHPARQLIDRMGACALGFDAGDIAGSQLEREIKRIVQVIEQYPETGRRVYQLVFEEFKKFLGRSLTQGSTTQAATLAQQVEQKEALSIQYTIELRKMLSSVPVRDEVREFLFRVWAEVLALAAVRLGPQHEQTLRYKQAAADLLWSVSAKAARAERSRVVLQLPALLNTLREGMATLAMPDDAQDQHIKLVNDAVMQAFVSRAEGMSADTLEELAKGLTGLEDVVSNDADGDVLLDPGLIEMMSGVDAAALEVIASGGSKPGAGSLAWARELELGAWFVLELSGSLVQVQYVWRSQRGQLHLFASSSGKSYLVQTRRLASYLQAGLLVPVEDEALTVRATREALKKLAHS